MKSEQFEACWRELERRRLPDGSFSEWVGGSSRPDATAWAIIALFSKDPRSPQLDLAREQLAAQQGEDGRVSIDADHPDAFWPTSIAALAWKDSALQRLSFEHAIQFVLQITGHHWEKTAADVIGHDPSLVGWPWIDKTHSWVEPTALGMLALRTAGYGSHQRLFAARRMLLDRQLPGGGWNYGNVSVFDHYLRPMPWSTGMALAALAGDVNVQEVKLSVQYLKEILPRLHAPLSLGWALLGLNSWGEDLPSDEIVATNFHNTFPLSRISTHHLCVLLLALNSPAGFVHKEDVS